MTFFFGRPELRLLPLTTPMASLRLLLGSPSWQSRPTARHAAEAVPYAAQTGLGPYSWIEAETDAHFIVKGGEMPALASMKLWSGETLRPYRRPSAKK